MAHKWDAMIYYRTRILNIRTHFVVRLYLHMAYWKRFQNFSYLSSYPMIIFRNNYLHNPGVLNAFTRKIGVRLGGVVDYNMVSKIYHLARIGLKQCLLLNKVEAVPHQFPQTCLNNCVTTNNLSSLQCVIGTYIIGCLHKYFLK